MFGRILYEDNHILAVFKPAGVLVQPDLPGGESLMSEVKEYLKEKYKKPGNVFLGLIHRLDRNVSGIVLFGKTSKGASRLSEQFRDNTIKKIYNAVVEGEVMPKEGEPSHYIKKDESKKVAAISDTPKEGYDRSELEYKTIKSNKKYTLVKIHLKTGRFHQIRAQFSAIGHPVAGDIKYGAKNKLADNFLALCATEIEFKTATTDEVKNIKIDYPEDWKEYLN